MAKKSPHNKPRRGDGQWLAWAASGLLTFMLGHWHFYIATSIYDAFLADELWQYDFAEVLVYPIFVLCLATGFFALALLLRFAPQVGILAVLLRKTR